MKGEFKNKVLKFEDIICRIVASFCLLTLVRLSRISIFDISSGHDDSLLYIFLSMLCFFWALCGLKYILPEKETDSVCALVFSTLCVFKWLIDVDSLSDSFLFTIGVGFVYSIFVFYFIHKNGLFIERFRLSNKKTYIIAGILALICAVVISLIGCLRLLTFSAPNFDFGIFANMFHNMSESGVPYSTTERDVLLPHFAVHISPIYYLILPFYYIFPSPHTLQIAQAVVLASGIIPLLMICRRYNLSNKVSVVMSVIYSFYPAVTSGCFYDLHENCFLLPLLLWTFCFFEKERYGYMYIFAFLTLCVKEDAAIYIIVFSIYVIFSRRKYLHGCILLSVSFVYFAVTLYALDAMGSYYAALYASSTANPEIDGAMVGRFDNLMYEQNAGLLDVLKTFFTNPGYVLTQLFNTADKLKYLILMLLPLGLIPFITKKISRYILIVPILINLLTDYIYQFDIGFQYHFGISAFLIYLTVMNISELRAPSKKSLMAVGSIACCCFYLSTGVATASRYINKWNENKESYKAIEKVLDSIPDDASVSASTMFVPYLADRDVIYQTHYHGEDTDVDYVVIDKRYNYDRELVSFYLNNGYSYGESTEEVLVLIKQ